MEQFNDDNDLIRQCLSGDNSAFDVLVSRYQDTMYRTVLRMVGDPSEARDITQNGFMKAWEKLHTFNFNYRFFSWLYRILVNESLNYIKRKKDQSSLDSLLNQNISADQVNDTPLRIMEEKEGKHQIQAAVGSLSPDYKVIIHLYYFEELNYQEIADVLEIEVKTVKSRLYTARQRLRDSLLISG